MFRDDQAARAQFQLALERKAARVDELEARVLELEGEIQELRARLSATPATAGDREHNEIYVDGKVHGYVAALITATDPQRTEGILAGAPPTTARPMIAAAQNHARTAGRPFVNPDDVKRAARDLLPSRILMQDPAADPRAIVRAIIDLVEVP